MIAPVGAPNFAEALRWGSEIYHTLKKLLKDGGYSTGVGDEGGFAPALKRNADAVELILKAIDPASSGFYENGLYHLRTENRKVDAAEMVAMYADWVAKYPIAVLEDGLAEDDWEGWKLLNRKLGGRIELVGDDIFVTNVERIRRGIDEDIANPVLLKLNQIGTLSETIAAVNLAYGADWGAMVSHRSGETVDSFIADLTVALGTGHLKTGAPCRGERLVNPCSEVSSGMFGEALIRIDRQMRFHAESSVAEYAPAGSAPGNRARCLPPHFPSAGDPSPSCRGYPPQQGLPARPWPLPRSPRPSSRREPRFQAV